MERFTRRHTMTALFLSLLAGGALATGVQAASLRWSDAVQLRDHQYVYLTDAAYSGANVAIVWDEYRPAALGVRTSSDGGRTFGPLFRVTAAGDGRVALCDNHAYVVYTHKSSSGEFALEMASSRAGSGHYDVATVATSNVYRYDVDIACNSGRVFVSWYVQRAGGDFRLELASALRSDLEFGAPTTLAVNSGEWPSGLRLAATDESAYAVYGMTDAGIYLKRWSVGPGPIYALNGHPSVEVATGSRSHGSSGPEIGVDGSTVAVAYNKCFGFKARVSHDRGKTWSAGEVISYTGCHAIADGGAGPSGVEVAGDTIALTWSAAAIGNFEASYVSMSVNDFRSFTTEKLGNHRNDRVGFMGTAGEWKLADAFTRDDGFVRFRAEH